MDILLVNTADSVMMPKTQRCLFVFTLVASLLSFFAGASPSSLPSAKMQQINDAELKVFLQEKISNQALALDKYDAEVWLEAMLANMSIYRVETQEALSILKAVYREASSAQLPPELILAVIATESSFNRFAVSRVGAQGLMQVMPFWKNEIGRSGDNLTDIDTNIHYGCTILDYYWQKANGNIDEALARYNGSYGKKTYSSAVISRWKQHWKSGQIKQSLR